MAKCKYCEYGEDNKYLFVNKKWLGTLSTFMGGYINENGKMNVHTDLGESEIVCISKKIKFCPMCGRKLQKGETNG